MQTKNSNAMKRFTKSQRRENASCKRKSSKPKVGNPTRTTRHE